MPLALSRAYQTPAFPPGAGAPFINAVVLVRFAESPERVLAALHKIEASHGRMRHTRWAARTLDMDLLDAGGHVLPDPQVVKQWMGLTLEAQLQQVPDQVLLPHPRAHERAFVLRPLLDVAPNWHHPVLGRSARELLQACPPDARASVLPVRPIAAWAQMQRDCRESRERS